VHPRHHLFISSISNVPFQPIYLVHAISTGLILARADLILPLRGRHNMSSNSSVNYPAALIKTHLSVFFRSYSPSPPPPYINAPTRPKPQKGPDLHEGGS
jgi:hypothetical protein